MLVDKKYVAHTDYQWRLTPADKSGAHRMQVTLGYGTDSENFFSESFQPGTEWQHVAFTYDGAGKVCFYRNGAPLGVSEHPGRGPTAPGRHLLSIGDRVGSNYAGFPGYIDEVRICDGVLEFRPLSVAFELERRTWRRMEKAAPIRVVVRNQSRTVAKGARLHLNLEGLDATEVGLPDLAPGATHATTFPFDTTLRPASYRLVARLEAALETPFSSEENTTVTVAARPVERMPVVLWGLGSPEGIVKELPRLKDLGFTHCLGRSVDYDGVWKAKAPLVEPGKEQTVRMKEALDAALAENVGIAFSISPGGWLQERKEFKRVDRAGAPHATSHDVDALLPGLEEYCYHVGASIAQTYGNHPAWQATLINSEVRDATAISFSKVAQDAYRKATGLEIPQEVLNKRGVDWKKLKDFPADRVIADDHPLRRFYQWFWTVGDGWNALHTATHRGIHSTGRKDVWTWFDPAIRVPSIGGSGGQVDVLGQWTYTNPDPLRIGFFTDELFAMAANSPQRPRVMKMTQLFWYRSQTAPKKAGAEHVANPFDDHDPDAAYITVSPVHLREAFWTKLARPVHGIMYHGWEALVPSDGTSSYRYTHTETKEEIRRLHREVLEPLGPALLKVGEHRSDVAYLDSFTSQMFAQRGSFGYSGDEAYRVLLHAQLQPVVVYEEQIRKAGLDGFKVLVLSGCDVLPRSVAERIQAFQKRGGIIIADALVAPAIQPDITLATIARSKSAQENKANVLAAAAQLRKDLGSRYAPLATSDNPEIVPRVRDCGAGHYVFVVNDHREHGQYVGQHGMVMEQGLPSAGRLTLNLPAGHVYDLIASREVKTQQENDRLRWSTQLGPGDGRVYLVTPMAIADVSVNAPETAMRGSTAKLRIQVSDAQGIAVDAVVPLQVTIRDPDGREAEFSGHHAAVKGSLELSLNIARNDTPGVWEIRARELASGREAAAYVRVVVAAPEKAP